MPDEPVLKPGPDVHFTTEQLLHNPALIHRQLSNGLFARFIRDRLFGPYEPWLSPDPNPFPPFDLLPRVTRARRQLEVLSGRVAHALSALLGRDDHCPVSDDDEDCW